MIECLLRLTLVMIATSEAILTAAYVVSGQSGLALVMFCLTVSASTGTIYTLMQPRVRKRASRGVR